MKFSTAPLRVKLVAALILPVIVVAGYLALRVDGAFDARQVAARQETEIARFSTVSELSQAVAAEQTVLVNTMAQNDAFNGARATTDAAVASVRTADLEPAELAEINELIDQVEGIRLVIGGDVNEFRLRAATEIASGDTGDDTAVGSALLLSEIAKQIMSGYDFDTSAVADVKTARGLNDIALVQNVRSNLASETAVALGLSIVPADARIPGAIEFFSKAQAVTTQSLTELTTRATPELQAQSAEYLASDAYADLDTLRLALDEVEPFSELPVSSFELVSAGFTADTALGGVESSLTSDLLDSAAASSSSARWDLIRSAGLGAGLFISVIFILIALYRSIRNPLARLTQRSQQIADEELPHVVQLMRNGDVDQLPEIQPLVAESNDEIGALVHAFNGMHRTAIELASEQAASRRVVADMFVNLGRRNQRLLNRMLKSLTRLERNEPDPDTLAALYDIDHLATRMRRNAESLLILAGAPGRRWKNPVKVYDVLRASLAEVEDYSRVQIDAVHDTRIHGDYVADLTHLVAELVENALSFSPPTTTVDVVTRMNNRGFVIVISDAGLGMTPELLASANARISDAAGQDETPSEFLGHYVVGRLAARHGIEVDLLEGITGGLTARIVLPSQALVEEVTDGPGSDASAIDDGDTAMPVRTFDAPTPAASPATTLQIPPSPAGLDTIEDPAFTERPVAEPIAVHDIAPAATVHADGDPSGATAFGAAPVEDASVFGGVRRSPVAQMPLPDTLAARSVEATPAVQDDPDSIRKSLAGFQSHTVRADREG